MKSQNLNHEPEPSQGTPEPELESKNLKVQSFSRDIYTRSLNCNQEPELSQGQGSNSRSRKAQGDQKPSTKIFSQTGYCRLDLAFKNWNRWNLLPLALGD